MDTDGGERRKTPAPAGDGGPERPVTIAAVMALTIVAGVGLVLLFPRPEQASPVELARPAPVGPDAARLWSLPAPPPIAAALPQPAPAAAPPVRAAQAKAAPPPLRTRRLELAQAARPHPERAAHVVQARTAPPRPGACRAPQSPADRLVCEHPALAEQDAEMRAAYDRALAAGADRLKVDRAQAQWRGRRDRATSEGELSQLYARRIAELDRTAHIRNSNGPSIA
jgi:uncharacterized protein YecT (DUF1311 family)